jgi:hypothetical protein
MRWPTDWEALHKSDARCVTVVEFHMYSCRSCPIKEKKAKDAGSLKHPWRAKDLVGYSNYGFGCSFTCICVDQHAVLNIIVINPHAILVCHWGIVRQRLSANMYPDGRWCYAVRCTDLGRDVAVDNIVRCSSIGPGQDGAAAGIIQWRWGICTSTYVPKLFLVNR